MSDQNVFNDDNQQTEPTTTAPSDTNVFADKLNTIVNEKGEPKYKSVEDALEALAHSQQFIETLKSEKQTQSEQLQTLQTELEKRKSVEEVANSLLNTNPTQKTEATTDEPKGLDENKVAELVNNILSSKTQEQQQAENLNKVLSSLNEQYGDKARVVVAERAKELGMSLKQMEQLSKDNPAAAVVLMGGKEIKSVTTPRTQVPPHNTPEGELPPPKKGMINGGASTTELVDEWRAIQKDVHKKFDVQS